MDADLWDQRYAEAELVWSAEPNVWVAQVTADLPPGRVLDLAAGEGRNALWLAGRGWTATAVDFSPVALDRARRLAAEQHVDGRLATVRADLATFSPEPSAYDLVLLVYLQVGPALRSRSVLSAAAAVAPGGRLAVVAHDSDNPVHGYGGPSDPGVLYSAADVTADLAPSGLVVDRADRVVRRVETPEGQREALDALVVARRPRHGI